MAAAMQEDEFLLDAASYAQYYEHAKSCIRAIQDSNIADSPPQEIIDNPQLFSNWLEQCKQACHNEKL